MRRRSGFGWLQLIVGLLLILLGVISFLYPGKILTGIIFLYGIGAVATGVADIIFYVRVDRHTGFGPTVALITGVLSVMTGIMLLLYPGAGRLIFSLLFPIWFITHCISRLSHLDIIRLTAGKFNYYFTLTVNLLGLVLGIVMIFQPGISLFSAGAVAGAYLILLGADSVITAIGKMGSGW